MSREPVSTLFLVPSLGGGGAERLVTMLLRCVDRGRIDPRLALLSEPDGPFAGAVPLDVPVTVIEKRSGYQFPLLAKRLARHFDATRPEVCVGFMTYSNTLLLAARRLSRRRPQIIATEHSNPRQSGRPRHRTLRTSAARFLYRDARFLVGVSLGVRDELRALYSLSAERVRAIPNAYPPELQDWDHALLPVQPSQPPKIVSVGRMTKEKGHAILVQAVAELARERPIQLLLVGDGPDRPGLERLVHRLGLEAQISFAGFLANPFDLMRSADVFVNPSLREGFGLVLVEAARVGAAIVATDCDFGPREIIVDGRSGLLVPPGDPLALANAIARLLDDPGLANELRDGAVRRAVQFSPAMVTAAYEDLICSAAGAGAA